jgi:hypothetical protein
MMPEDTPVIPSLPKGYSHFTPYTYQALTPVQQLQVIQGMHAIVHAAHQAETILSDLGLNRFGIKIMKNGDVRVKYIENKNTVIKLNHDAVTILSKSDIYFLGQTFKILGLNAKLTDPMTHPESSLRLTDEQIANKFKELMPQPATQSPRKLK